MNNKHTSKRKDDNQHLHIERSNRLYKKNHYWFFKNREGIDFGPFESELEAQSHAKSYVEFLALAKPEIRSQFLQAIAISA